MPSGIDIRNSGSGIIFRLLALDDTGALVTSGTMTLKLYRYTTTGLESFDFDDSTFKTTALTTETVNMAHRTGNNGTTDTGIWTYFLPDGDAGDFSVGDVILAVANHASMEPSVQAREIVYGGAVGDVTLSAAGSVNSNVAEIDEDSTAPTNLAAAVPTDDGINLNMGQALPAVPSSDTTGEALKNVGGVGSGFGSAPDTLIGHLRAIMSKSAPTPSGLGTYDTAVDSQEALRDRLDAAAGAGFTTSTDSLQAIRDAIDTLIAPAVVSNPSVSGQGFLSDCIGLIRRMVDEPSTAPKYTNGDILEFLEGAFDVILTDMNIETDHPIYVRHDIEIKAEQQDYILPVNIYQILQVAKINDTTKLVEWELWPGSIHSGHGKGFSIENNTLRLHSRWGGDVTMRVTYVPGAEVSFHSGTAQAVTATTLTLAADPPDGSLDTRKNAYAGYMVRILSSDQRRVEERVISEHNPVTGVITFRQAWDTTPTGTVVYEVVPQFSRLLKHVVCLRAAMDILAQEKNDRGVASLMASFQPKMTTLRRAQQAKMGRFPGYLDGDTLDNSDRYSWGAWGSGGFVV